ncbi:murein biosynthesis integral membrane protein MurJ [Anaerobacillus isosaccharinicus]|uniref:Probable lipid II flippase MurJ n=1 Tax=Anaerobacillus isosaccharinicus TaxID=1532552 RepID=A0A1S2KXB6_9BACI|nr:murein biosynthesis integral membrane protein MurJ [Anaerobacillus isosaccharinicus]MBA5586885.1 murein biosynthesis integral membrane protein MurJ [Anaerobacillus isosaccharinicus]QOY34906.1 murein biosynthesis integral membrane protein MurJ [Anaerobacillus isosaccharinicus]
MKKTVIILMILTIISKILGFMRDVTLSFFYGASNISDVFLIALTIPTIFFAIIGQGIVTGYIPMCSLIKNKDGYEKATRYTNNTINIVMVTCTILIIIGLLFTEAIVKIIASGFEGSVLELAVVFTRITMVGIYFTALIYIFSSYLQIKGLFYVQGIMGLPLNIFFIAAIIISAKTNVYILAMGSLFAIASQLILIVIYAYKKNYRYQLILDFKDENIRKMVLLALPAIMGASITQINVMLDRTIASRISEGGISALNYASTLSSFILGIFVLSISTVIFPKISKMAVEKNLEGIKKSTSDAINVITLLVIPATIGYIIYAGPIVKLLFGRGAFDESAVLMTSYALIFYSIGIIGFGIREVLSKTFYSLQDVKTPMLNAGIAMILNIVLNIILSKFLGIGGLALATSISAIFCTILLMFSLRKKIGSFGMKGITKSFVKILMASIIMGIISKLLYIYFITTIGLTISLLLSICIAIIVYVLIISFMKIDVVDLFIDELKNKLKILKETNIPQSSKVRKKA